MTQTIDNVHYCCISSVNKEFGRMWPLYTIITHKETGFVGWINTVLSKFVKAIESWRLKVQLNFHHFLWISIKCPCPVIYLKLLLKNHDIMFVIRSVACHKIFILKSNKVCFGPSLQVWREQHNQSGSWNRLNIICWSL